MSWNKLLIAIEGANIADIALLNLVQNTKSQQIILSNEGRDLLTVLRYVNQLQAQPMLEKVYLQKHTVDTSNLSKPVKFTIFTYWRSGENNMHKLDMHDGCWLIGRFAKTLGVWGLLEIMIIAASCIFYFVSFLLTNHQLLRVQNELQNKLQHAKKMIFNTYKRRCLVNQHPRKPWHKKS